jgi:energy-coupling factor transporter ATP-binding protein EcfA2
MADPIIQINHFNFTYPGGQKALDDITLDIAEGEYLAIVGANGAGKTTLCLLMNGVIPNVLGGRLSGSVHVCGLDTFTQHVYDIAQFVGLVLQDPESQLFAADVRSEIAFAAENRGIPRQEIIERMEEVLRIVRLEKLAGRLSDELSGGQKQRLAIAANLIVRPRILVADEPTSQLDPVGKDEVFATLNDLNRNHGMTVVVASHDVDEISRYAQRVVVLNQGKIILEGTPEQVFRETETLDRVYVHVPDIVRLGKVIRLPNQRKLSLDVSEAAEQIKSSYHLDPHPTAKVAEATPGSGLPSVETAVNVSRLTYTYPGTQQPALQDISFEIPTGQFVAMIGQNGAGKTTLMKCLVGLFKPEVGEVRVQGQSLKKKSVRDVARMIGLILQNPDTQLFTMSVEEEIRFGLLNLRLGEEEIEQRVEEAITITGLDNFRTLYPFKLSLGDRRKVAVAAIVAMRPEVLIFDEPLTGQDYKGRYELTNLAAELHKAGHTVILISHDMELVAQYSERTLVLGQGRLLLDAPTREVFDQIDILRSTFIEPPEIIRLAQQLYPYGLPKGQLNVNEVTQAVLSLIKEKVDS